MWDRGVNERGQPLTKFERRALVERWCELFGCLPRSGDVTTTAAASAVPADDLERRNDDDLMTCREVAEELRTHVSTIS
jgi:hypothetical protein